MSSAILPIASAIMNGIGNIFTQYGANEANIEIARENRDWQSGENQKNRDYLTEMWNRQNEYNTPANQRKLLHDAGYNPFVLQQNGSTSAAGSAGTPAVSGAPNMPHVQPILSPETSRGVTGGIMDALTLSTQNKQVDSNVALAKSEILQNMAKMAIESYDKLGPKGFKELWNHFEPYIASLNFEGSRSDILFQNYLQDELSSRYNLDSQSMLNDLQYDLQKRFTPQQVQKSLEEADARIKEIMGRLDLMDVQSDALIKKTAAECAQAYAAAFMYGKEGEKFEADAKTINDMRDSFIKMVKANAQISEVNAYFAQANKESSSNLVGFMTSKEGREWKAEAYRIGLAENSSLFVREADRVFGNYFKMSASFSPDRGGSSFVFNPNWQINPYE